MDESDIARLQEQVKTLFNEQSEIKKSLDKVFDELQCIKDKYADRLPNWATIFIGTLMAICGWLVSRVTG